MAPLAPFKASFKDRFKTHTPIGIRALSTTNLNLVLLNVYKISKDSLALNLQCQINIISMKVSFNEILTYHDFFHLSMAHEGLTNKNFDNVSESSKNVATRFFLALVIDFISVCNSILMNYEF